MPMLQRYLHYMLAELPRRPLKDWGKSRAGDQIDTAFWVYNRTGDPAMLQVADLLHAQAYDWTDIYTHNRFMEFGDDFQPRHGVNVAQAMKMPPVWYQRSGAPADRDAFRIGLGHLLRGTTFPLDVLTGTEMLSGRSAIQGVETCTIVEQMLSDETAFAILADPAIADALERTAYNAMPGAMTKDLKLYQYYTATNNVIAIRGGHGFDQDYDNAHDARTGLRLSLLLLQPAHGMADARPARLDGHRRRRLGASYLWSHGGARDSSASRRCDDQRTNRLSL